MHGAGGAPEGVVDSFLSARAHGENPDSVLYNKDAIPVPVSYEILVFFANVLDLLKLPRVVGFGVYPVG